MAGSCSLSGGEVWSESNHVYTYPHASRLAVEKYSDILIQRDNGVTIQHGRRQHASWSSDRYRHYVENIVSRLAIHYGNNPTVIGWQIDNEPGHYGW